MLSFFRLFSSKISFYISFIQSYVLFGIRPKPVIFCFFPFSCVGGSEKVHLDILKAISDNKPHIFIRYKINPWLPAKEKNISYSENTAWLHLFKKYGRVTFLSDYLESTSLSYVKIAWIKGKVIGALNSKKKAVLFFWNDPFVKTLFPKLKSRVAVIDIVHNHKPNDPDDMVYLNMDVVNRIDKRILVSPHLKILLKNIYSDHGIPDEYLNRAYVVLNGVTVPSLPAASGYDGVIKVIFVARDTAEKRIYLVNRIARETTEKKLPLTFTIVGPDPEKWKDDRIPNIKWLGLIPDEERIKELFSEHHIFLLTSSTEGLPKAMIEAMSAGCIPLVPVTGSITDYIKDGTNGYLLPAAPEDELVGKAVSVLKSICENPGMIEGIRANSFETVKKYFNITISERLYRSILIP